MSIEAMKQVLEALEEAKGVVQDEGFSTEKQDVAITSIRQAIAEAEQEQGEPVAEVTSETGAEIKMSWWHEPALPIGTKLYTTPQQRTWVGLTDEERNDCLVSADPCEALAKPEAEQLMEDIEAKLKDKNL